MICYFVVFWTENCLGFVNFVVQFDVRKSCHQNVHVRGKQHPTQAQTRLPAPAASAEPLWSSLLCWTVPVSGYSCVRPAL